MARWADGDQAAGRAFYERHAPRVGRLLVHKLADDAADAMQRVFLRFLEACRRDREIEHPRAYLLTMARNELYDRLRGRQRNAVRFDPAVTSLHDLGTTPTQRIADRQERRALLGALRRIPLELQLAVELYYWERLPMQEVAEILGVTRSAAINRVHRARARLREVLERESSPDAGVSDRSLASLEDWAAELGARELNE